MIDYLKIPDYKKDFEDSDLTEKISKHKSFISIQSRIKDSILNELKKNKYDLIQMEEELKSNKNNELSKLLHWTSKDDGTEHDLTPNFSNIFDMVKGVKITINDVWGYNVFIENYRIESDICHFDLKIELFDHFGLDLHDVKKFGNYPIVGDGFKIWFYLQHNKKFEKQIFPFVVRIPITQNNIEVHIFEN